jgi:hypothetical protein
MSTLSDEEIEALAERLRGLLNLELRGEDFAYALIFVERERFEKDREPTPVVVANCGETMMKNIVKMTARSL